MFSNAATVNISVSGAEPPPPPPGDLLVTTTPYKIKGVQHVDLTWENFAGPTVTITRDTTLVTDDPTANDGEYMDNIGAKGGGSYIYEVCETGTSNCASAAANF